MGAQQQMTRLAAQEKKGHIGPNATVQSPQP
jgi:hypothetical protein